METTLENSTYQKSYLKNDLEDFDNSEWEVPSTKYIVSKRAICKKERRIQDNIINPRFLFRSNIWPIEIDKPTIQVRDKTYSLPNELQDIAEVIVESDWICDLEKGWDLEDAPPISKEVYKSAIDFLINYSLEVFRKGGLIISAPEINPCKNGSVDLSWRAPNSRLLINIRKVDKEMLAYFYGDFYNNESPIKGYVRLDGVLEHLAIWMKSLA